MLAKLTSKNQLTLPKAATAAVGAGDYFQVETRNGQIILTPVRLQRADAVRAKLAELALTQVDLDAAITWARQRVAEPDTRYTAESKEKTRVTKRSAAKPGPTRKRAVKPNHNA